MKINKLKLNSNAYPDALRHIPSPPSQLFYMGASLDELLKRPRVAIVGTRRYSSYGKLVTVDLATRLAEQGLLIISGLALGLDAAAHRAALEANGLCLAVLPSPLDNIVPTTNRRLAQQILDKGGALVSEYSPGTPPLKQNFIARNRIVAGLAEVVVITEAGAKSGAIYTANFGLEQGKEVLAVPGNISQLGSKGTNSLVKANKAGILTDYQDVLHALKLEPHKTHARQVKGRNQQEQKVLDLLLQGVNDGFKLLEKSKLATSEFNQVLTMLEITGQIRPLGANQWALY